MVAENAQTFDVVVKLTQMQNHVHSWIRKEQKVNLEEKV